MKYDWCTDRISDENSYAVWGIRSWMRPYKTLEIRGGWTWMPPSYEQGVYPQAFENIKYVFRVKRRK